MRRIKESPNPQRWPRCNVKSVECRKRDLVVRIADWSRDKDEPAFDVEVYIGGVYDWEQSESFTFRKYGTRKAAAKAATEFAAEQIKNIILPIRA